MDDTAQPDGIETLTTSQCWQLLREATVGRLAIIADGEPDIFPVNHIVDHGAVVFRTGNGTMFTAALHHPVAFEVDGLDEESAWSVVARGHASEGQHITDLVESLSLPVAPWQAGTKPRFLRIEPTRISGRRFRVVQTEVLADTPSASAPPASKSSAEVSS
ncbi:MAG: pyridoxamine 5'-phosphate oxidase family protein [Ornithinimicrobium sp.]